jgi:hypothetical protein
MSASRHAPLVCLLLVCAAVLACAAPAPPPPTAPDTASSTSTPSLPASSATAQAQATEPTALQQRPLDLTNNCPHEMHVYYGEKVGDGKGQANTVAGGAVVAVPRSPDGAVVVWVTDEKGTGGLASVHVTKRMRHVRIDASCLNIDADSVKGADAGT